MDEAEEKIRQRRERIEQWRKEKALKDIVDSETSNNQLSATLSGESHQVKPQWSLEDDDEDEAEIPNPLDVKATEECRLMYYNSG